MRKILLLSAAVAVTLAGCSKSDEFNDGQQTELTFFNMMQKNATKGYITGTEFKESTLGDRDMQISAYLHSQTGPDMSYFSDKTFKKNSSDNYWQNYESSTYKPLYWPIGGTLDFLAFSAKDMSKLTDVTWNNATSVSMKVTPDYLQDDIVFAYTPGKTSESVGTNLTEKKGCVPMQFKHSQAWIQINVKASDADIVTVKSISLVNVNNDGKLTVNSSESNVTANWDFTEASASADITETTDKALTTTSVLYKEWLIPEQKKTSIDITYTLANNTSVVLKYNYDLSGGSEGYWQQGKKYVYNVTITATEITVDPSMTDWTAETPVNIDIE